MGLAAVSLNAGNDRKCYVPYDDGSKATGAKQETRKASKNEDILNLVLLPREILEL